MLKALCQFQRPSNPSGFPTILGLDDVLLSEALDWP